ncbi:MAG TPA: ABC transporter permease [Symbiobacteriaceae bacterium]|nr:ABC transporter permease [Symbiobacteriaceae bacterium]
MPPELGRITLFRLMMAGLRRSHLQSAAGLVVALLASAAFFGAALLLTGGGRMLDAGLAQLGADLVVAPKGRAEDARLLLAGEEVGPLPLDIPVADWRKLLKTGKVIGVISSQGIAVAEQGRGVPAAESASFFLIKLEKWASPLMAAIEVEAAIPGAEVVVAEQATRNVTRSLQPMVRLMAGAAGIALLGAIIMAGLMTSIRVGERRGELGMLRAVGAPRRFLVLLTLGETTIPALAGALAGILLGGGGLALSGSARAMVLRLTTGEIALFAGGALLATLAVMVLASLLPALRAAHMDPLDAVRRGR